MYQFVPKYKIKAASVVTDAEKPTHLYLCPEYGWQQLRYYFKIKCKFLEEKTPIFHFLNLVDANSFSLVQNMLKNPLLFPECGW